MDLILDYPEKKIAFVGLFMMNLEYQGKGIGSKIIAECCKYLKTLGFEKYGVVLIREIPRATLFGKRMGLSQSARENTSLWSWVYNFTFSNKKIC
jgi:GNAT superfamily N-acetyltransferase